MNIEFKYYRDGDNPNLPIKSGGMRVGTGVLWAKIRDKWVPCPDKSWNTTFTQIKELLETDKVRTLEADLYRANKKIEELEDDIVHYQEQRECENE